MLRQRAARRGVPFVLLRHGGRHDVFLFGSERIEIPRHREIREMLARSIIRNCDDGKDGS
ncbi:type II toxin-antitoxin system HicA family toxin [Curtobacterium sp. MCBD17_030]|nr:type II toxin-antitoxin system HicA family toxin [Curtobacterium sp. MCBD17_030]